MPPAEPRHLVTSPRASASFRPKSFHPATYSPPVVWPPHPGKGVHTLRGRVCLFAGQRGLAGQGAGQAVVTAAVAMRPPPLRLGSQPGLQSAASARLPARLPAPPACASELSYRRGRGRGWRRGEAVDSVETGPSIS